MAWSKLKKFPVRHFPLTTFFILHDENHTHADVLDKQLIVNSSRKFPESLKLNRII